MKNRKKGNMEKFMMLSALLILGGFFCASLKMKVEDRELPVFRSSQIEGDDREERKEEETADGEKRAEKKEEDAAGSTGTAETLVYALEKKQIPDGCEELSECEHTDDGGTEWQNEAEALCRTGDTASVDRSVKKKDILGAERGLMKKITCETEDPEGFPSSLWTGTDEKTLLRIFYAGGLKSCYCTGASDLNPGDCRIYAAYSDGSVCRVMPLSFQAEGFGAEHPGSFQGKIGYQGMWVTVPYEVADFQAVLHLNGGACVESEENMYHLRNYTLEAVKEPQRTGYLFCGWYLDEGLTEKAEFPLRVSEQMTDLYARWERRENRYDAEDGLLVLPEDCTFIGEREFSGVSGKVEEIYIGASVLKIEEGAFLGLKDLCYIDADWKNPCYTTINCGLYTKDGKRLLAYPNALTGSCRIQEGTEALGKYSCYESRISTLVLPKSLKSIEDLAFGRELKLLKFQGMTPPESLSPEAFAEISEELIIEVPESALEAYRETFEKISPKLAEKTRAFHTGQE